MRLATKIPLLVLVTCLAGGALASLFLAAGLASDIRRTFEQHSTGLLRSLAATVASMMSRSGPDDRNLQQALDNLEDFGHGRSHGIEWIAFADCDGRVVAHSDPRRFHDRLHEVDAAWLRCDETAAAGPRDRRDERLDRSGDVLVVAVPITLEQRVGTVVAEFSLAEVRATESRGRTEVFLAAAALACLLAAALTWVLRRTVARPLARLTHDTAALRRGDLDHRSALGGADEVGQLAGAFNAMADRLAHHARHLEDEVAARTRELEDANRELARLATTDALTGLLNRRRMQEILVETVEHHRRKERRLSVVMIDLDYFKRFNDTHGHLKGDELLRTLGARLRTRKRAADAAARLGIDRDTEQFPTDGSAARYGGEEFVLILPETDKAGAVLAADRLREGLERDPLVPTPEAEFPVTLSAGVATFPDDADDVDGLLRAADDALYRAKREGRNRVIAAGRLPAGAPGRASDPPSAPGGGSP
jgi:GGDEF domain-containing protein/HAMP domain-containing protein